MVSKCRMAFLLSETSEFQPFVDRLKKKGVEHCDVFGDIGDMLVSLAQNPPNFVVVSANYPHKNVGRLPSILEASAGCGVLLAGEKNDFHTVKMIRQSKADFKVLGKMTPHNVWNKFLLYKRSQEVVDGSSPGGGYQGGRKGSNSRIKISGQKMKTVLSNSNPEQNSLNGSHPTANHKNSSIQVKSKPSVNIAEIMNQMENSGDTPSSSSFRPPAPSKNNGIAIESGPKDTSLGAYHDKGATLSDPNIYKQKGRVPSAGAKNKSRESIQKKQSYEDNGSAKDKGNATAKPVPGPVREHMAPDMGHPNNPIKKSIMADVSSQESDQGANALTSPQKGAVVDDGKSGAAQGSSLQSSMPGSTIGPQRSERNQQENPQISPKHAPKKKGYQNDSAGEKSAMSAKPSSSVSNQNPPEPQKESQSSNSPGFSKKEPLNTKPNKSKQSSQRPGERKQGQSVKEVCKSFLQKKGLVTDESKIKPFESPIKILIVQSEEENGYLLLNGKDVPVDWLDELQLHFQENFRGKLFPNIIDLQLDFTHWEPWRRECLQFNWHSEIAAGGYFDVSFYNIKKPLPSYVDKGKNLEVSLMMIPPETPIPFNGYIFLPLNEKFFKIIKEGRALSKNRMKRYLKHPICKTVLVPSEEKYQLIQFYIINRLRWSYIQNEKKKAS